uniref:AAA_11 domain-containing protein n=1 Tax=Macrostomum lignano TaxID=282301 RepID=A0A1I8J6T6_9PLAT
MEQVKSGRLSDDAGIRLYLNVKVVAVKAVTRGAALRIAITFDLPASDKGPSDWSKSSRLMHGNLLCLSLDEKFTKHFWAIVVEKRQEELNKKERLVWIQPCRPDGSGVSVGEALVSMLVNSTAASSGMLMLESPTMYKSFQPVLASLKSLSADSVPFSDVLAYAKVESASTQPDFVTRYYDSEHLDSEISSPDALKKQLPFIKHSDGFSLDHCQTEAFANALHRKVYVCQGPPGTGKTLLGILIAKQLLKLDTLKGKPLLVLCYKNHALDEFLTKLLPEYGDHMVRVGGRSQDYRLDNISLRTLKNNIKVHRPVHGLLDELRATWMELQICLEFLDTVFESPEAAILNACDYGQLYEIVHCRKNAGDHYVRNARGVFNENKELFKVCLRSCFSNLNHQLNERKPCKSKVQFRVKQKVQDCSSKPNLEGNEPGNAANDEDDSEEIREREEHLGMTAQGDDHSTGNDMRFDARFIRQSELYLDSSIGQFSQTDFIQRLLSRPPTRLDSTEQWLFYQCALNKVCNDTKRQSRLLVDKIMNLEAELERINIEADASLLSTMRVIGMTVTGASINKELLDAVKPAVVILEEAAEVSEPQLLGCLGPHTEQLILIGDHKQLKATFWPRDYHLDLSMMERLINNGIKFDQLELQNRMRPEFSLLLRDIYPNLRDNTSVVDRVLKPACLVQSMFFWTHNEPETQEPGRHGAINTEEAKRCVRLAMFLVDQGCSPDRITILCAYKRQMSLKCSENSMHVKVHTIDLYQGDENDVVIVSLVRSNPASNIGFLKTLNRRCVAQSRARLAMVFVGNADCIYKSKNGTKLETSDRCHAAAELLGPCDFPKVP